MVITCRTSGSTVTARAVVDGELLEQRIRCRATPIAHLLVGKIGLLSSANPEWTFERVLEHACWEIECAYYAQAKRRFGRAFARGVA